MIEVDKYIDTLETFRARPINFAKDLEDILRTPAMRAAMAAIEEQALLIEKTFVGLDYSTEVSRFEAHTKKVEISTYRRVIEMLIDMTKETSNG